MSNSTLEVLQKLETFCSTEFPSIKQCITHTQKMHSNIDEIVRSQSPPVLGPDTGFVVYGSLAREEATPGSDIDWTVLVDGQADAKHIEVARKIQAVLKEAGYVGPGRTGTFGETSFSHSLVNHIGGANDTNINMTRRILLLLESRSIGGDLVRERVVRCVLGRYIYEDVNLPGRRSSTPRFLLNDIVRFWRTMAVDYATKTWERDGDKWALRNAKLRMSRKLLFTKGMLSLYNYQSKCRPSDTPLTDLASTIELPFEIQYQELQKTPLALLGDAMMSAGDINAAKDVFSAYDLFLEILSDENARDRLAMIEFGSEVVDSPDFKKIREISHQFQSGLDKLFFADENEFSTFIRTYAVF